MMIDNPELRAKILDWQRRYNIQDGDPAMALLELVQLIDRPGSAPASAPTGEVTAKISSDSLAEAVKTVLLPAVERLTFQAQEIQQKLEATNFEQFTKQIETYHEGIDYCTKKLDVIKKETDSLVVKVEKAATQIQPITRGAVIVLMLGAGVIGFIIHAISL